ncbi:MAG: DUF4058 family protein [Symploca sp. SIO1B1]|nr:DUF4058 family protein [Symploca sp. SIO1B1]
MPSPFPGMNPYLENPNLWSEVHHRLISAIAIALASQLRPKYRAAIEKRIYLWDESNGNKTNLVGIPDVAITKTESEPLFLTSFWTEVLLLVEYLHFDFFLD